MESHLWKIEPLSMCLILMAKSLVQSVALCLQNMNDLVCLKQKERGINTLIKNVFPESLQSKMQLGYILMLTTLSDIGTLLKFDISMRLTLLRKLQSTIIQSSLKIFYQHTLRSRGCGQKLFVNIFYFWMLIFIHDREEGAVNEWWMCVYWVFIRADMTRDCLDEMIYTESVSVNRLCLRDL